MPDTSDGEDEALTETDAVTSTEDEVGSEEVSACTSLWICHLLSLLSCFLLYCFNSN